MISELGSRGVIRQVSGGRLAGLLLNPATSATAWPSCPYQLTSSLAYITAAGLTAVSSTSLTSTHCRPGEVAACGAHALH